MTDRKLINLGLRTLIVLAVLVLASGASYAECCNPVSGGICGDGTCGTPCCGYGKCNIFCCNCDGGCRTGCVTCGTSAGLTASIEYFDEVDANDDHVIDAEEFAQWAGRAGRYYDSEADAKRAFDSADRDGNGQIEPAEFDRDVGKAYKKVRK